MDSEKAPRYVRRFEARYARHLNLFLGHVAADPHINASPVYYFDKLAKTVGKGIRTGAIDAIEGLSRLVTASDFAVDNGKRNSDIDQFRAISAGYHTELQQRAEGQIPPPEPIG